jgi:hypothetical protein
MQSKTTTSLSIALISLALLLAACQPGIKKSREVEEAASPLLRELIQETDLSGEWHRLAQSTTHYAIDPTRQNQQMIDFALRVLAGEWEVQRYNVMIMHSLKYYSQSPPRPQVDSFQSTMGLTNTATISPNLILRGESMSAKCWKDSGRTVCNIVTSYPHLLSDVTVYAPAEMSDVALMELLNQILNQSDQRIIEE